LWSKKICRIVSSQTALTFTAMRSALLWMLILFVGLFHVLTVAYSPLPRTAEVVYASHLYGQVDLKACLDVARPDFTYTPVFFKVTGWFTQGSFPSIFRYRIAGLLAGLLCLPLIYLMAHWAGMRKLYADLLLLLLCFEPGYALLLHNGQADTMALLIVLLGLAVLTRRAVPGYGHYGIGGLLLGLAILTIMPIFWIGLVLAAWLVFKAIRHPGWQAKIGPFLFVVGMLMPVWFYVAWSGGTLASWWTALMGWRIPVVNYTLPTASEHQWWYIYPWHYAIVLAGAIIVVLWIVRHGLSLSAPLASSILVIGAYFVLVQPQTGNSAFALPLIYFSLLFMADFIGQQIGWYAARPWVLGVVGNNIAFSAGAIILVMSSLGGRDYAMADYEIRTRVAPGQTVAADARYYFSIIKNGDTHLLISTTNLLTKTKATPLPSCLTGPDRPDYVLLHETTLQNKQGFWPEIALAYDTLPKAKLRSYIPMQNLSRNQYGWLAQRNQEWQMNYDGILLKAR
jgi:hypothetical protein